jgi:hypothetical protein
MIYGDSIQLCPKTTARLKRAEAGNNSDQNFLRRVFGVFGVIQHAARDVVDPSLMAFD